MAEHGTFYWNELMAHDIDGAKKFYADTLGWSFDAMPMADGLTYWVAMMGGRPVGGMFDVKAAGMGQSPEGWMPYIAVDDIDARCAKAKAAGASILREPFDVPGVGRIAILQEPGGAVIGWMTAAEPQGG
ncbi:VOC family protein [Afifella pfennigii]|uniref:VOC family protein n=1 Tax=Afifella pfennigii TaxID=209897 RepID=UPI00047B42F8|nr:VOC family protein [Afifella pfennigii]